MIARVFLVSTAVIVGSAHVRAADSVELAREYEQVRKIAMRDPKVRAAFDTANQRLEKRIIELDPALATYRPDPRPSMPGRFATRNNPVAHQQPAGSSAIAKAAAPHRGVHVVAKGETLGVIAAKHGTTVAELRRLNEIQDDRRLAIGQRIILPGGKAAAAPKKEKGMWERLKSNL